MTEESPSAVSKINRRDLFKKFGGTVAGFAALSLVAGEQEDPKVTETKDKLAKIHQLNLQLLASADLDEAHLQQRMDYIRALTKKELIDISAGQLLHDLSNKENDDVRQRAEGMQIERKITQQSGQLTLESSETTQSSGLKIFTFSWFDQDVSNQTLSLTVLDSKYLGLTESIGDVQVDGFIIPSGLGTNGKQLRDSEAVLQSVQKV